MFWLLSLLKYFFYFVLVIVTAVIGLLVYLLWFQPAFNFPKPTGQYAVGTTEYHWVDINRKESYSEDPKNPYRELMVRIWYPAEGPLPEKPIRFEFDMTEYLKKNQKLMWLFGLSRPLYSYVVSEAPIMNHSQSFPIIIFSPGAMGNRDSNVAHCEELASYGYIVIGISHTYDSYMVHFPDGRIINMHQRAQGKNFNERRAIINEDLEIRVADVQFIIDQLEKLNTDLHSKFYQKLNVQHIGVFGQSFGGSMAIQSCRRDPRIKAAVDMDGSLFGPDALQPFDKPLMFIIAGDSFGIFKNNSMKREDWKHFGINSLEEEKMVREIFVAGFEQLAQAIGHDVYILSIQNASHLDLSGMALLKESTPFAKILDKFLSRLNIKFGIGSINGFRITTIVNDYLLNFFNKYLKGEPAPLLDGNKMVYTEVENIDS